MKTITMLPLCSVTPTASPHQMLTAVVHGGGALRPVSLSSSPSPPLTTKLQFNPPSIPDFKSSVDQFLSSLTTTFDQTLIQAQNAVKTSSTSINSFVDRTGESAGESVKNTAGEVALVGVEALKRTIVGAEELIGNGASFALRSLETAKQSLPPEINEALDSVLNPAGIALRKVYGGIQGIEATLGLDPNDPILPFLLLVGTSASLWVFYWVSTYSGYAGDLSPELTLDILSGKDNTLLVDIRPEVLREKDGVPDLRRAARYRYTSVAISEVSKGSQFKNVRELEDALTAVFIRNLKIAQDRSKVIVLDADGSRSKQIARSLKKLGVKEPYLVQGGFRSWAKEGLRIKELKPETAFSILNEEAEAIFEDIKPSPLQVFGLGVGLIAASYAFLEWETTLQYIGVIGIGQTVLRRVASYEGAEDFKRDVGVLLTPARVGSEALGWAAAKLDTNRVGLPTSPSSTDVQNRVLQAAAKHESQPSEPASPPANADLSEA